MTHIDSRTDGRSDFLGEMPTGRQAADGDLIHFTTLLSNSNCKTIALLAIASSLTFASLPSLRRAFEITLVSQMGYERHREIGGKCLLHTSLFIDPIASREIVTLGMCRMSLNE